MAASKDASMGNETGAMNGDDTSAPQQLRLDVYPSDATPDLLPQSIELVGTGPWADLTVPVSPTVSVSGSVSGFLATPYLTEPTVPGSDDVPVKARIDLFKQGSIAAASIESDSEGTFALEIPAGQAYHLAIVPEETTLQPFSLSSLNLLTANMDLGALYLSYGAPIWGVVHYSDQLPAAGAIMHLVDDATGAEGPKVEVDSDGSFMLRAFPGSYELVAEGSALGPDPTVVQPVTFESNAGTKVDIDLGPRARSTVKGRMLDSEGQQLQGTPEEPYRVRLSSLSIDGVNGSLVAESSTGSQGVFKVVVPPGQYLAEFIPPYDVGLSPIARRLTRGSHRSRAGRHGSSGPGAVGSPGARRTRQPGFPCPGRGTRHRFRRLHLPGDFRVRWSHHHEPPGGSRRADLDARQ